MSPKIVFVLAMLMAMGAATLPATPSNQKGSFLSSHEDEEYHSMEAQGQEPASLQGPSRRLLALNFDRYVLTCDTHPWVCSAKGSWGPECCMKRCVNVTTNMLNCGKCGKTCKYFEICCEGQCVKLMSNKKHCGRCNNNCKKGSSRGYGMCSYA
jgi:hypothetical protein